MSTTRRRVSTPAAIVSAIALVGAALVGTASPVARAAAEELDAPYTPTWESVSNHDPSPDWFKDAKFGVYWHWGAFSTPAFGSEWYGRDMYRPGAAERQHHIDKYGDPATQFGYEKFITGGTDKQGNPVQFKPVLASEGGDFDPAAWLDLVEASGARFAGPVAEHHDGYSMWDSQVNEWNSVDMGPKLDLLQIFADEVRKRDMKLLVAMHQAFNYNGFYMYAPQQTDPSLKKLYGQLPRAEEDQLWFDKQREVIDQVQPDIIWNDFSLDSPGWCHGSPTCSVSEQQRLNYLSYYFNKGEEWGKDVVTTYKHFDSGFRNTSAVEDYERGGPADIVRPYWLTDDAISSSSWSYTEGIGYYNSKQMIHSLIDRVSKNGNMLLNISPTASGVIPEGQKTVLRDMGAYLDRNGESIYDTRAWDIYGEGPNRTTGGSFTAPLSGDGRDVRYTRSKADDVLYATFLGWPGDGAKVSLQSLSSGSADVSGLKKVELLGPQAGQYVGVSDSRQTSTGLEITMPTRPGDAQAYVVKLTFDGHVPTPLRAQGASLFAGPSGTGEGVSLAPGKYDAVFLEDAGVAPDRVRSVVIPQGSVLRTYSGANQSGTMKSYTAGTQNIAAGSFRSLAVVADHSGPSLLTSTVNSMTLRADATATAGAQVTQRALGTDNTDSVFVLEPAGEDFVRIVHKASGLVVDGMNRTSGSTVELQRPNGSPNQEYSIVVSGEAVMLLNRGTGLALDSGGLVSTGSPLKQWANNGSPNLQFRLTPVVAPKNEVKVTTAGRTVAGKAYLSVTVRNESTVALDIALTSSLGSKTFARVMPGKSASVALNSRSASYPAGQIAVEASTIGTSPVISRSSVGYSAFG